MGTSHNPLIGSFDVWWQKVEETYCSFGRFPLDFRTERRDNFRGRLACSDLGAVKATEIAGAGPTSVFRTQRSVRRADPEIFMVALQTHCSAVVSQEGREVELTPGEFTITDSSRSFQRASSDDLSGFLTLAFPRSLLPLPYDVVAGAAATPLSARSGVGRLTSSFLAELPRHIKEVRPGEAARVSRVVLDLLATTLSERLDYTIDEPVRDRALATRVHAFIDAHLHLPELSPDLIAANFNVSVRQLYRLFEAEQEGVAGWIRARRLDRIRRDLTDPALSTMPINQIIMRWGFIHAAHVNRLFKAAHEMTPSEFRRLHQP